MGNNLRGHRNHCGHLWFHRNSCRSSFNCKSFILYFPCIICFDIIIWIKDIWEIVTNVTMCKPQCESISLSFNPCWIGGRFTFTFFLFPRILFCLVLYLLDLINFTVETLTIQNQETN